MLRFTLKTVSLVGETAVEWDTLERQARAGRWTTAPLTDAERLAALASELGVPLREGA